MMTTELQKKFQIDICVYMNILYLITVSILMSIYGLYFYIIPQHVGS